MQNKKRGKKDCKRQNLDFPSIWIKWILIYCMNIVWKIVVILRISLLSAVLKPYQILDSINWNQVIWGLPILSWDFPRKSPQRSFSFLFSLPWKEQKGGEKNNSGIMVESWPFFLLVSFFQQHPPKQFQRAAY